MKQQELGRSDLSICEKHSARILVVVSRGLQAVPSEKLVCNRYRVYQPQAWT